MPRNSGHSADGFSLVEALLAIVLIGLAVALISNTVIGASTGSDTAGTALRETYAAQAKIEELLADSYWNLRESTGGSENLTVGGETFACVWAIEQVDVPGSAAGIDKNFLHISVTVSGVTLESYTVNTRWLLYKR